MFRPGEGQNVENKKKGEPGCDTHKERVTRI